MSDSLDTPDAGTMPAAGLTLTTPAGLQSIDTLTRRRRVVFALNVVTYLGMLAVAARILGSGGWTLVDVILFLCFAAGTPWTVLGFWNALIGLWLLHFHKGSLAEVAPFAAAGDQPTPLRIKTAVFMTVRNEDPERAILRLKTVKASIDATGEGGTFSYFVLSDTSDPAVAAAEESAVEAWKATDADRDRIVYRRRTENTGFKAGNVRDFCARWGKRLRAHAAARRRQPDVGRPDRAAGAHDAGPSQDRHPAEPGGGHAVHQCICPHLPVRHAPRHALLHHGAGLVGGRVRSVLGPQRLGAHQALPRAVRPSYAAGLPAARRPRAEPRPGRGHLDAPRRLRGARAAGRARQLGGEPAHHARVCPPRRALVPGQHAVSETARPARASIP